MINGAKLGVAIICAALVWGCAGEPRINSAAVQDVTFTQARSCSVVDTFRVESRSTPVLDIEREGLRLARTKAAERGGDAILLQSTSLTPSSANGALTVMTLKGQILVCRPNVASK